MPRYSLDSYHVTNSNIILFSADEQIRMPKAPFKPIWGPFHYVLNRPSGQVLSLKFISLLKSYPPEYVN